MAIQQLRKKMLAVGPAQAALKEFEELSKEYEIHMIERGPREPVAIEVHRLCAEKGPFDAAFILFANTSYSPIDEDLLSPLWKNGNKVGCFALCGSGYSNVDVDLFTRHGCYVTNTPDAVTEATADFTVLLLLSALRASSHCESLAQSGNWRVGLQLTDCPRGKTIGVFGMGRIGKSFARKMRAFGVKILYNTRTRLSAELEAELGIAYAEKDDLLKRADIISCLCPETPETHHLLDERAFELMKDGVYIVNSSRGGIISNDALINALKSGKVTRAALDVLEDEPKIPPYLFNNPQVMITPHVAAYTIDTIYEGEKAVFENMRQFLQTGKPVSPVNGPF